MSKSKQQGTAYETEIVRMLQSNGLTAERLAEGGLNDLGDVMLRSFDIVIEAKDRAALNVHETLVKAERKTAGMFLTVLFWKRRTRKNGNTNRTQVGEPVVVMSAESFLELLSCIDSEAWAVKQSIRSLG